MQLYERTATYPNFDDMKQEEMLCWMSLDATYPKAIRDCDIQERCDYQSLRTSGATSYTALKEKGPMVAGLMALSISGSQWDNIYACREHLYEAGLVTASNEGVNLAELTDRWARTLG